MFKRVGDLSGGERGRLSLAKLMLSEANFLILDEPTNHLDIVSREILEAALNRYEGTVLFVSHDRYFINKTATRILNLTGKQVRNYIGNYDYFLEKRETEKQAEPVPENPHQLSRKNEASREKRTGRHRRRSRQSCGSCRTRSAGQRRRSSRQRSVWHKLTGSLRSRRWPPIPPGCPNFTQNVQRSRRSWTGCMNSGNL